MVNWDRLAQGRDGFKKQPPKAKKTDKPKKTLEQSCADEVAEIESEFKDYRDRMEKERSRRRLATDSEFWFAVCFTSREEKERFLRKYGLMRAGDKYLAGKDVDRILDKRNSQGKDAHQR